jgi:hypothetical protein
MSKNKVVLNSAGIRQILTSPSVQNLINQTAHQVSAKAGTGFGVKSRIGDYGGSPRALAVVFPQTKDAYRAQYTNYALERAIGGK